MERRGFQWNTLGCWVREVLAQRFWAPKAQNTEHMLKKHQIEHSLLEYSRCVRSLRAQVRAAQAAQPASSSAPAQGSKILNQAIVARFS